MVSGNCPVFKRHLHAKLVFALSKVTFVMTMSPLRHLKIGVCLTRNTWLAYQGNWIHLRKKRYLKCEPKSLQGFHIVRLHFTYTDHFRCLKMLRTPSASESLILFGINALIAPMEGKQLQWRKKKHPIIRSRWHTRVCGLVASPFSHCQAIVPTSLSLATQCGWCHFF